MQRNPERTKCQGTGKMCSLYRGTFPYILLLVGRRISFVTPGSSLYWGRYIGVPLNVYLEMKTITGSFHKAHHHRALYQMSFGGKSAHAS